MLDTLRGIFRIFHLNSHSNCAFTQKVVILNFVPKFFQKISDHPHLFMELILLKMKQRNEKKL